MDAEKNVAPYTGAWIETPSISFPSLSNVVAPYTGAWIETIALSIAECIIACRPLHGGVD